MSRPFFCSVLRKPSLSVIIFVCLLFTEVAYGQNYTKEEGKKLLDQEEYDQAKEVLLKVVEKEPENPEVNFLLCQVFLFLGDHDQSIEYGEKAVKLNGSVSDYHLWLGQAYGLQAQKGSKLKAIFRAKKCKGEYEKAILRDSTNVNARLALLQYLVMAPGIAGGDKDKAKKQAEIIPGIDSLFGAIGWAVFWGQENDSVKTESYLQQAVRLDTTFHHQASYLMGSFLVEQKRHQEAVEIFEKLYQQHPNEMSALYQIGRSYLFAKDSLDKAERCFKRYLQTKPKRSAPSLAAAHWRLGMVYDLQGKKDSALTELEEAVRLDPKSKEYKKTLDEVKKKK